MADTPTGFIQLGELCRRLNVREREARYVLEQGFVPAGVEDAPESGHHRQFGPGPAFWLGMVLKLKAVGLKTPLAAQIADCAESSLQGVTQNLSWDWTFLPKMGRFDTEYQYYAEVGDLLYFRLVTNANPSGGGQFEELGWYRLGPPGKPQPEIRPCVMVRLDLSQIAKSLKSGFREA